jgi:hypothetical protein
VGRWGEWNGHVTRAERPPPASVVHLLKREVSLDGEEHMMLLSVYNKVGGRRMMFWKKLTLYMEIMEIVASI